MNNETQHTPGPWRFSKVGYGEGLCYHIQTVDMSHRNTFIGEAGGGLQSDDEITANAALIASAPSLFKENQELKAERDELKDVVEKLIAWNNDRTLGPGKKLCPIADALQVLEKYKP